MRFEMWWYTYKQTKNSENYFFVPRFNEEGPVSYLDNQKALDEALERLDWPVSRKELVLLVDEITQGPVVFICSYLQNV